LSLTWLHAAAFDLQGEVEAAEHGTPLDYDRYPIGSILELLPYHSCAAVKMHDQMHVLDEDGKTLRGAYNICRGW
jgi:D-serine deaminase-like pyridoxal phosphate-dependent protein